jgi:hypothetical protein
MKNKCTLATLTIFCLLAGTGNNLVKAESAMDLQINSGETSTLSLDTTSATTTLKPIAYDYPLSYTSITKLVVSTDTSSTLTSIKPTAYNSTDNSVQYNPESLLMIDQTAINSTGDRQVSLQSGTTATMTTAITSEPQTTYYYGPPQLSSSNPTGGGAISGSNYKFAAQISDPNNLVHNVRFVLYDTNRNVILDSDSNLSEDGSWIASKPFDSTKYPDGYGYALEITSEGDSGLSDVRYTLSWNSVYFGIDNLKSSEIVVYPEVGGSTIINKEYVATAYQA